ncbi:LytR C-terminal domain-containing protein [Arthrobacter sp. zg-Y1219]|uniref:LytR C-terminal domain-containing protein n=1 Tax=Arthrobacter sp. zg-Y1219 TaxID=3049067 RepID=UPI0024C429E4|nr:LytR C-terminal domain-containing protein [Arthrobacter sp. zg-Y1219]MDK1361831.1 LytR C-terminal domain-containing protein [Arthrobacter sp. zg-Y1219]
MSKYPRDEFDKVPETSSRQGVHRERLIPSRSGSLALIITVGVLALVLGLAAYFVLPRLGIGQGEGASAPASNSSTPAESPESRPAGTETAEPAPSASPTPSASPSPTPSPTPAAVVDRSQPVVVLNASGIGGLGANVSALIAADGWTTAQVANWGGTPLQTSVIFYGNAEQLPNAQELSRVLGIPNLRESPEFTLVTVAPGPGFQ